MSKELSKTQKGLLIGLGVGVAAPAAIVGGLALVGFGAGGVVAGSIAAAIQSSIGSVAAGSAFATCQSIGAAGLAASTQAALVGGGATIGGLAGKLLGSTEKKETPNATEEVIKKDVTTDTNAFEKVQENSDHDSENEGEIQEAKEKGETNTFEKVQEETDHDSENEGEIQETKETIIKLKDVKGEYAGPETGARARVSKPDPKYTLVSLDNAVINISPSINLPKLM